MYGEKSTCYKVTVRLPKPKSPLKLARFEPEYKLEQLLESHADMVKTILRSSVNVESFIRDLSEFINRLPKSSDVPSRQELKLCEIVLEQVQALGWHRVKQIDLERRLVLLNIIDSAGRVHEISASFAVDFPDRPISIVVDLPVDFQPSHDLAASIDALTKTIEECQSFWELVEDVDRNLRVLQPKKPTNSCTFRRVALSETCSMMLEIDPKTPRDVASIQLLGPQSDLAPFEVRLQNLAVWSKDRSLRENLIALFGDLPSSATAGGAMDVDKETPMCGICYGPLEDSSNTEKFFDCSECNKTFHLDCLVEWIQTLPDTRRSFNRIFASCPNCQQSITVTME